MSKDLVRLACSSCGVVKIYLPRKYAVEGFECVTCTERIADEASPPRVETAPDPEVEAAVERTRQEWSEAAGAMPLRDAFRRAVEAGRAPLLKRIEELEAQLKMPVGGPVLMVLFCPACRLQHVDRGEWETRPHRTHRCEACGAEWLPANVYTVGVEYLPENQYTAPRVTNTRIADAKAEGAREERETLMRTATPWSLVSIVETLANSVQHYLFTHDCDHHGWENSREASIQADEWVSAIRARGDAPAQPDPQLSREALGEGGGE